MKRAQKILWLACLSAVAIIVTLLFTQSQSEVANPSRKAKVSGAGIAMDGWSFERSYPFEKIPVSKYRKAFQEKRTIELQRTDDFYGEWESLGPINVGGRTLCLAFHPTDLNTIFAGTAGGGLWKTTSLAEGQDAWTYISTGFPVLAVASIAIDPNNPDIMYIGTGETYGETFAEPGIINRLTRGTYGIGILKSIDGGTTWSQSLEFSEDEIKGVQDVVISATNGDEAYAATTDGVYRTLNAGDTWELVLDNPNCIDIELDPNDENIVYVTQGNFNGALDSALSGIFKSVDKGDNFTELLDDGLITAWSGNAKLSIDPNDSNTLYASIQVGWFNTDDTTPAGLYKSTDAGDNWTKINDQNVALYQGWYSHDIAINPNANNEIIYAGIDFWKSENSGSLFNKESDWQAWPYGELPVEMPNGGPNYVHADIHAIYYHPLIADKVFCATDGGVFASEDGGETFTTSNGGLQTTQFYPNMSSSTTDPNLCIAGAQDNATYIYRGNPAWWRVIGGDGMSTAIRPDDDDVIFGSYQRLNIQKSTNQGYNFSWATPNLLAGDNAAFLGPYQIASSDNDIMYGGARYLYKSTDSGSDWNNTSDQSVDGTNTIIKIAISHSNEDKLFLATSPDPLNPGSEVPKLFRSVDGGESFEEMEGLPDRICKDIEVDPNDDAVVYAVFSGFGNNHVYKTINSGDDWFASDIDLPDLPTNTIVIDPENSNTVYVGNDIGVFVSLDASETWTPFCNALPDATMVMDLNISPSNSKLRIATHGHGIYQRDLVENATSIEEISDVATSFVIFPNPATDNSVVKFELANFTKNVSVSILDINGKIIDNLFAGSLAKGIHQIAISDLSKYAGSSYFVRVAEGQYVSIKQLIIQ